jgi:hypothetical protein
MVVPLWARSIAALIGGLLVLVVWANVVKTLIVPRPASHGLAIRVTRMVNRIFRLAPARPPTTGDVTECGPGRRRRFCWPCWRRGWGSR